MFTKLKLTVITAIVLGSVGLAAARPAHPVDDTARAKRKAKLLEKFDANRNGALDPSEKEAMHEQRALERFTKLDANGDGKLTFDEFKAGKHGMFKHGKHGKHHGRRGKGPAR